MTRFRRRKKAPEVVGCRVHGPWTFSQTPKGVKRICRACGYHVTEMGDRTPTELSETVKKNSRQKQNIVA
jgi:hypothetical protein